MNINKGDVLKGVKLGDAWLVTGTHHSQIVAKNLSFNNFTFIQKDRLDFLFVKIGKNYKQKGVTPWK